MKTTIQISDDLRKRLKIIASRRDVAYEVLLQDMVEVFQELDREKTLVSLPQSLATKARVVAQNSGFKTLSEFTTYVMREATGLAAERENTYTKKEERLLKKRLKSLGYLE